MTCQSIPWLELAAHAAAFAFGAAVVVGVVGILRRWFE